MEAKLELNQRSLSVDIQLPRLYSNTIILNLNPRAEKKTHTYNCNLKPVKMPLKTMIRLKSLDDNRLKKYPTTHLQPFEIAPSSQTNNKWHSFLLFIWFYQSQIYTRKRMKPQHSVKHVVVLEYVSKWMKSSAFYSVLRLIDFSGNWIILSLRAYRYPIQNHFNLI